jgi:hypothetical protein
MITSVLWGLVGSAVMLVFAVYLWTRAEALADDEAALFGLSPAFTTIRRWAHRAGALLLVVAGTGTLVRAFVG